MSPFQKATKSQLKLRLALAGPSGSGKTYSALALASNLGKSIAVIDSEKGTSQLYADTFDFDVLTLTDKDPRAYVKALKEAANAGYEVVIIDSLSHAWEGALTLKDEAAKRSRTNDSFGAWRTITPIFNDFIDAILTTPAHVVCTLRTKTAYELSKDDRTGKNKVEKLGMEPQFRSGVEYEFDIVGDMDLENNLVVTKTRFSDIAGKVINRPGADLAAQLLGWLNSGEPANESATAQMPEGDDADETASPQGERAAEGVGGTGEGAPAPETVAAEAPTGDHISGVRVGQLVMDAEAKGITKDEDRYHFASDVLGREVTSWKTLTTKEANKIAIALNKMGAAA